MEDGGVAAQRRRGRRSMFPRLVAALSRALWTYNSHTSRARASATESANTDTNNGAYSPADNEEACAKIWSIYISEAERYDAALVESWRADMEGMLIFSGLFSASLTAFLVESYKTLQPDPGYLTVQAIQRVSEQLAAIANGTSFDISPSAPFRPPREYLLCNVLWFISLSLSLTCALLATLVEQWAREFLHKTEMLPSPVRRARVFSFLYFGLKRFQMHAVVDALPLLLHSSLLLFFAGLVAFLMPVNGLVVYVMGISLGIFVAIYAVLTVLPVIYLDCPFRTPLSAVVWSMASFYSSLFSERSSFSDQTMTEAVVECALKNTHDRDQRALRWTLDSLTDDDELLPFIEAIPDAIHGPQGFRGSNDYLFDRVLGTTQVASPLVARICNLLARTQAMRDDDPLKIRRRTASLKALWAVCMMSSSGKRRFDFSAAGRMLFECHMDPTYHPTALLAIHFHDHIYFHHLLSNLRNLLLEWEMDSEESNRIIRPQIETMGELLRAHQRITSILMPADDAFQLPTVHLRETFSILMPSGEIVSLPEIEAYRKGLTFTSVAGDTLDDARRRVGDILDWQEWHYGKLTMVARFLQIAVADFTITKPNLPFEAKYTCHRVLSQTTLDDLDMLDVNWLVNFGDTILNHNLNDGDKRLLDDFAQIAFHPKLLPFLEGYEVLLYFTLTRDVSAVRHVLRECDLEQLARSFRPYLRSEGDSENLSLSRAVHAIVNVANSIVEDSEAIQFLDQVIQYQRSTLPQAITAIRYLRSLKQFERQWYTAARSSPTLIQVFSHPRLQALCQHDLLRPRCPLFLPKDVNLLTVWNSIGVEFFNLYLAFLSDFLVHCDTPIWAGFDAFGLHHLTSRQWWSGVDPDVQLLFFNAVLTFTKTIAMTREDSDVHLEAIADCLWSRYLFWTGPDEPDMLQGSRFPFITEIEALCLQLLLEALATYHRAAESPSPHGRILKTAFSHKLMQEVRKELRIRGLTAEPLRVM